MVKISEIVQKKGLNRFLLTDFKSYILFIFHWVNVGREEKNVEYGWEVNSKAAYIYLPSASYISWHLSSFYTRCSSPLVFFLLLMMLMLSLSTLPHIHTHKYTFTHSGCLLFVIFIFNLKLTLPHC